MPDSCGVAATGGGSKNRLTLHHRSDVEWQRVATCKGRDFYDGTSVPTTRRPREMLVPVLAFQSTHESRDEEMVLRKEGVDPKNDDLQDPPSEIDHATWTDVHRIDHFSWFSFSTVLWGRLALKPVNIDKRSKCPS